MHVRRLNICPQMTWHGDDGIAGAFQRFIGYPRVSRKGGAAAHSDLSYP